MSVLVKGMDMPKNCWECPLEQWGTCYIEDRPVESIDRPVESIDRPEWCPLEQAEKARPQTEMHDAEEEKQRKKIEEIEYQNRKLRDKVYYQEGYQKGCMDGFIAHQRLVEERDR